ncbi:YbjN domain-containing protein, partial [Pseudomonas aeruginosa]|nr:YbjN domain-containing protein [Pseudomonas aeruginosa]
TPSRSRQAISTERWNLSRRFGRLSQQGEFLVMEMDVIVAGGVSPTGPTLVAERYESASFRVGTDFSDKASASRVVACVQILEAGPQRRFGQPAL